MNLIRIAITQGRSLRQKHKLRIRQPLASMVVVVRHENQKKLLQEADLIFWVGEDLESFLESMFGKIGNLQQALPRHQGARAARF